MRKITVIYINKKKKNIHIKQLLASLKTARNKKAIILIALLIPLIFLVILLFSHLDT
ncbi:MAG TPA: hypothetical protein PK767_01675 [Clostridiales bacterium]|nr:hypothetical protein [Clostridiales bacterium]HOL91342.1 hypothetical protein [Clostridiales bacterium]HPP34937.1 hypothetical protein [Clostridiales bacterium]